jgi:hypothetical protein
MGLVTYSHEYASSTVMPKHTIVFWLNALTSSFSDIRVSATDDNGDRRHCGRVELRMQ